LEDIYSANRNLPQKDPSLTKAENFCSELRPLSKGQIQTAISNGDFGAWWQAIKNYCLAMKAVNFQWCFEFEPNYNIETHLTEQAQTGPPQQKKEKQYVSQLLKELQKRETDTAKIRIAVMNTEEEDKDRPFRILALIPANQELQTGTMIPSKEPSFIYMHPSSGCLVGACKDFLKKDEHNTTSMLQISVNDTSRQLNPEGKPITIHYKDSSGKVIIKNNKYILYGLLGFYSGSETNYHGNISLLGNLP